MADAVTGGDTKKLFAMMEKGQLDPNTVLPKFFEELEARAAGGWEKYIQTSGYWQNMTGKRLEDLVKLFAANGGNEAFVRIWKTFAETLKDLDGITLALTKAFVAFSKVLQEVGDILVMVDRWVEWLAKQSPALKVSIELLAAAWFLLATAVGRSLIPILGVFFALSDIQSFLNGEDSIIGRIMDMSASWEDWAVAILSVVAALTALKGVAKGIGLGGLFGDDDSKGDKKGKKGEIGKGGALGWLIALLSNPAGQLAAVGTASYMISEQNFGIPLALAMSPMIDANNRMQLKSLNARNFSKEYLPALLNMSEDQVRALGSPELLADYKSRESFLRVNPAYTGMGNNENQFNITIQTPSTDPAKHANIVVDIINKSLPFYAVGEGAG